MGWGAVKALLQLANFTLGPDATLNTEIHKKFGSHKGSQLSSCIKIVEQGVSKYKQIATLKKFYGRHHDLVNLYNVAISRIVSLYFANGEP